MLTKSSLKLMPITLGLLFLGACATTGGTAATEKTAVEKAAVETPAKTAKAETLNDITDNLTQTNRTEKSADGEVICKRTTSVGSRFHKKVCATADEWAARAAADKKTTSEIQRSAGPGVSNSN